MTSGIYSITCSEWIYIGQSWDIERRWRTHKKKLLRGEHTNLILQRLYDKHGLDQLTFSIIEVCSIEDLNRLEIFYLGNPPSQKLMNMQEGGQKGCAGRVWTPEAKLNASRAKLGSKHPYWGRHRSKEEKLKISQGLRGLLRSAETKQKMRRANLGSLNPMYGKIPWNKEKNQR